MRRESSRVRKTGVLRSVVEARAESFSNEDVGRLVAAAVEAELGRERLLRLAERAARPTATRHVQRDAVVGMVGALFDRLPSGGAGPFLAAFLGAVVGHAVEGLAASEPARLSARRIDELVKIGAARGRKQKTSLGSHGRSGLRALSPATG
jgi:hypothetical protein